jgi:phosphohistidine phosphatase
MRRLLLFRHSKAERSIPGAPDRERALNERGQHHSRRVGAYMATHALVPDGVLVSPARRTQETWTLAAKALHPSPACAAVETLYDATPHAILAAIKMLPATLRAALIVGHNPGLHELALMLIASGDIDTRERLREGLPTCGLAVIDFAFDDWNRLHPHSGRLDRFVSPRALDTAV